MKKRVQYLWSASREKFVAWWKSLSFYGLYLGTTFYLLALTPSLIPRPWLFQGVIAGISFAMGYAIGAGIIRLWVFLELPQLPHKIQRYLKIFLAIVLALKIVLSYGFLLSWQNQLRELLEMTTVQSAHYLQITLIAAVTAFFLFFITHGIVVGLKKAMKIGYDTIPRRYGYVLGVITFCWILIYVVNGAFVSTTITVIDTLQAATDTTDPEGASPPMEAERSGSPDSLIAWDRLGKQGKGFVTSGARAGELEEFSGEPAKEPIRAYVALRTEKNFQKQAELALEELKRTDAFSREALVLATPTGTGWVDEGSIGPLEYMFNGDIATLCVQYSYMQSPLSLILEPGRSQESARIVFEVIYNFWKELPEEERPKLYLFGLSLGAHGSESSMPIHSMINEPFQGAVWAGPPFRNELWRTVQEHRNASSTAWLPHFEDGSLIRVLGMENTLAEQGEEWGPVRLVYIAYPTDAIVFFEESMWIHEPEWLSGERGEGVSDNFNWHPVVSFWQVAIDMMTALHVTPGYGHNYTPASYIDAWVEVANPEDWTEEDTARLKEKFTW